jgi:hypothetical protein
MVIGVSLREEYTAIERPSVEATQQEVARDSPATGFALLASIPEHMLPAIIKPATGQSLAAV